MQQDRLDRQIEEDGVLGTFSASFVVAAAVYGWKTFDSSFPAIPFSINDNNHTSRIVINARSPIKTSVIVQWITSYKGVAR